MTDVAITTTTRRLYEERVVTFGAHGAPRMGTDAPTPPRAFRPLLVTVTYGIGYAPGRKHSRTPGWHPVNVDVSGPLVTATGNLALSRPWRSTTFTPNTPGWEDDMPDWVSALVDQNVPEAGE